MSGAELALLQDNLAVAWNSRGPNAVWDALSTMSEDEMRTLLMMNIGARAAVVPGI